MDKPWIHEDLLEFVTNLSDMNCSATISDGVMTLEDGTQINLYSLVDQTVGETMNIRFEIMCNLDCPNAEMEAIQIEEHLYYLMENILGVDCGISVIKADEEQEIL